jgi:hypothetical protein
MEYSDKLERTFFFQHNFHNIRFIWYRMKVIPNDVDLVFFGHCTLFLPYLIIDRHRNDGGPTTQNSGESEADRNEVRSTP